MQKGRLSRDGPSAPVDPRGFDSQSLGRHAAARRAGLPGPV